ncbi:MAG TPA: PilZ domain-containing protein [Bryobacteraceae bacterium]|nr:PilZ domain-containing protein [Bryobacteraceae bacterium]
MIGNLAKLASAIDRATTEREVSFVERRAEPRLWCSDLVQVWWKPSDRWKRKGVAVLEDISRSGACIQLEVPLPFATPVRIKHPSWNVEGEVRYCMYRDEGYFIGVHLSGDSNWDEKSFRPKHLLDPSKVPSKKK